VIGPSLHYIQGPPHLLMNLDIREEHSDSARVRARADDSSSHFKIWL
jgi:hypothetical protein